MSTMPPTPEADEPADPLARLDALLPWYLNGSLEEPDLGWVHALQTRDPAAALRIAEAREVQRTVLADPQLTGADLGWADFAARHGLAENGIAQPVAALRKRWWAQARHAWTAAALQSALLAVALAAWWTGHLPAARQTSTAPTPAEWRSTAEAEAAPHLERVLRFRPDVPIGAVHALLLEWDAVIVAGPSQAGEFRVRLGARVGVPSPKAAEQAWQALARDPRVQQIDKP